MQTFIDRGDFNPDYVFARLCLTDRFIVDLLTYFILAEERLASDRGSHLFLVCFRKATDL